MSHSFLRLLSVLILVLPYLLLAVSSERAWAQQPSVRSELSASTITRDESVTLTVVAIGIDGELDTSALDRDFEVIGRSSSRQISTVTGSNSQPTTTSIVTWALELLPRDIGVFTVPAVTVGGVSSQLLSLTVNDIPTGATRDVFVEANVDTRSPWVQSQVLMTLRVFQAIEIVDGGLSEPSGDDLEVQRIGEDTRTTEIRDGRQYSVTERRFALFPQKSGLLVVDPITLTVSVPADPSRVRGFFSPTRKLTRRTDAIQLEVQARPPSGSAWWLPASAVTLDSEWTGGTRQVVVDQPLTRSITLRAGGVMDTQLPDISLPAIDGASLYAEEPTRAMGMNNRGLVAEQTIKWALIPQREGELELPAITVQWFNTDTGRFETAALPEEILQVGPPVETPYARAADPVGVSGAVGNAATGSAGGSGSAVGSSASLPDVDATSIGNASGADSTLNAMEGDEATSSLTSAAGLLDDAGSVSGSGNDTLGSTGVSAAGSLSGADSIAIDRLSALQRSVDLWRTAALGLLALWLTTAAIYLVVLRRRRADRQQDHGEPGVVVSRFGIIRHRAGQAYLKLAPLASVEVACNSTDPTAARTSLLEWATRQWPGNPPRTLTALASRLTDAPTRELIRDLDASLYSRTRNPAGTAALMSRLTGLPEQLQAAITHGRIIPAEDEAVGGSNGRRTGSRGKGLPSL